MSSLIFEINNGSYEYPTGQKALVSVNLQVAEGERLGVIGANASGKSTLLYLLGGLRFPNAGVCTAYGRELSEPALHEPEFRRFFRSEVGILFQNVDAQLFCATVEEDIAFGPLQLGLSLDETRARVDDVARLCGVENLLTRQPYALSGGEKKRVALASVLAVNPSALLLDEPTAGLDPRTEMWLAETLNMLATVGKTIIIATHDLTFAGEFATRVVAMGEDHTIAAQGTPEEILADIDLLLRLNLIHSHAHGHGTVKHAHPHLHTLGHGHEHGC